MKNKNILPYIYKPSTYKNTALDKGLETPPPPVEYIWWPKNRNKNLFDGDKFFCPVCNQWKSGRSKFLANTFRDRENTNWLAQMIIEIKGTHFGYNYHKRIQGNEDMIPYCNRKALWILLKDVACVNFMKKNKITPDDIGKLRDMDDKLKKKSLEVLGVKLVWK